MLRVLRERIRQGHRTIAYPGQVPALPARYRGAPRLEVEKCRHGCDACLRACPVEAISGTPGRPRIDLGRCVFCGACVTACPMNAIKLTGDFRMSSFTPEGLVHDGTAAGATGSLDRKRRSLFARSLKLRQVSAGGCNACEADINVLSTVTYDLGRFGIQVVASPRHADGIIVTGPVTRAMRQALLDTYEATPGPKVVIACGSCAISGGPFRGGAEVCNGVPQALPVDLYLPGCPPHPLGILDGLLRLIGRA